MKGSNKNTDHTRQERRDRLIRELDHDPYHSKRKLKGPRSCPNCGAVYLRGRWTWETAPSGAKDHVCPACQRIKDGVPAAFLTLRGGVLAEQKTEIINLITNYEQRERAEHPLKRVIDSKANEDGLLFTLTDAHLARGIGEALRRAYGGELDYQYTKEDLMLRVTWTQSRG